MKITGKLHKLDPHTKGYELDGILTQIFGHGAFVWIYLIPETKEFYATDQEPRLVGPHYKLFSAGQVGIRPNQSAPQGFK